MQSQQQTRLSAFIGWFQAFDPGWIRLESAARAVLVMVVTLLIVSLVAPQASIFGFFVCFILSIAIADSQVAQRKRTTILSLVSLGIALTLASLFPLETQRLPNYLLLLVLVFIAFYARRYGAQAGELAMIAAIGYYIADENSPTLTTLPQFLFAAVVAVVVFYVFQFYIIPYNPERNLRRGMGAFYETAASLVGAMIGALEQPAPADQSLQTRITRYLRQVHFARTVASRQLAGVTSPTPERRQQIQQFGLQLYNAESGLEIMSRGVGELAKPKTTLPPEMRQSLIQMLAALQNALSSLVTPEQKTALLQAYEGLREQAKHRIASGESATWSLPLLQIAAAVEQVGRAVEQTSTSFPASSPQAPARALASAVSAKPQPPPAPQAVPVRLPIIGETHLHPTVILGIQAVVAMGIAMLVSTILNLENPNWAYWTAFVVIVGAAGETLQKIQRRVLGTVAGGIVAAFLLYIPGIQPWIPILILVSVFLAIFTIAINYAYFVFFISIMVLLLDAGLAGESGVVVERIVNIAIGASVAALVAIYVLPLRIANRLKVALAQYLNAADQYLTSISAQLTGQTAPPDLDAQKMKVADTFESLSQTLPSAVFEENPLAQAHSPLTSQTTTINALNTYLNQLTDQVQSAVLLTVPAEADVIHAAQVRVHENIQALAAFLTGKQAASLQQLNLQRPVGDGSLLEQRLEQGEDESLSTNNRIFFILSRIHRTILELGEEFGAAVDVQPKQAAAQ